MATNMPTEHVDAFVAQWRERAALMRTKPGFLDTRPHRALSSQARFQLVNVAHWESHEAWQAATADPEFQQRARAATADPRVPISAHATLYQVAVEFSGPAPDEHRAPCLPLTSIPPDGPPGSFGGAARPGWQDSTLDATGGW
jgi:heme oxygenase (mycobilin-producing)